MTFREEIAAILNDTDMLEDCKYGEHNSCPKGDYQTACRRCALDRILLAVSKLAAGLKDICPQTVFNMVGETVKTAERQQREAEQALIRKELE